MHRDVEVEREVVHTTPTSEMTNEDIARRTSTAGVDRVHSASYDPYAGRRRAADKLIQGIYLVFGLVESLIAIRFILRLLGANPDAGFAQFIYDITAPMVAPFVGLFNEVGTNGNVFEPHSLVALIVYALVAWLLAKIAWLLVGETRSGVSTRSSSVDTHIR